MDNISTKKLAKNMIKHIRYDIVRISKFLSEKKYRNNLRAEVELEVKLEMDT